MPLVPVNKATRQTQRAEAASRFRASCPGGARRGRVRRRWLFPVAVLCVLSPPIASAETPKPETRQSGDEREQARTSALEGIERLKREDWEGAHERLSRAYALFPAPTVAVLDAGTLEKLGRWVEAQALYRQAAQLPVDEDSPEAFQRARKQAEQQWDRLEKSIPTLAVALRKARPAHEVRINGTVLARQDWGQPRKVDPGDYNIVVVEAGVPTVSDRFSIGAGDALSVVVVAAPPAQPPPPALHRAPAAKEPVAPLTWASLGVGAAGLAVGVVAGALMLGAKADLDDQCRPQCPPAARDTLDRFRTLRIVSAAGYSAGTVGMGLGLFLYFDRAEQGTPELTGSAAWSPGETGLHIRGTF
jgi:tetratricopeptide (TPR) repeat protein